MTHATGTGTHARDNRTPTPKTHPNDFQDVKKVLSLMNHCVLLFFWIFQVLLFAQVPPIEKMDATLSTP